MRSVSLLKKIRKTEQRVDTLPGRHGATTLSSKVYYLKAAFLSSFSFQRWFRRCFLLRFRCLGKLFCLFSRCGLPGCYQLVEVKLRNLEKNCSIRNAKTQPYLYWMFQSILNFSISGRLFLAMAPLTRLGLGPTMIFL